MTVLRLSPRQRDILIRLENGAVLQSAVYRGSWRYVLDELPVDGRSVDGLVQRDLVRWADLYADGLEMTLRGRQAIRT